MAFKTFHPFSRLPKELRDRIWDFAVLSLPRWSRAHFFTLFNEEKDAASVPAEHIVIQPSSNRYGLAAPQSSDFRRLSWTDSNPSAYLSEIGLWGACKESREIMQKLFEPIEWDDWDIELLGRQDSAEIDLIPALGTFTSSGQSQNFTVYPKSDLLCLQPFNFDSIDLGEVKRGLSISRFGVGHVALVFNPALGMPERDSMHYWDEEGPLRCVATAASDQLPWVKKLWFIDYRIYLRPGPTSGGKRQEFYGNSYKYVEVQEGDTNWELGTGISIFEFLWNLEQSLDEYFATVYDPDGLHGYDYHLVLHYNQPEIGVLACEMLKP